MMLDTDNALESIISEASNEVANSEDSHPTFKQRIEYIPQIEEKYCDYSKAAVLFSDLATIQEEMTVEYTKLINHLYHS